MSNTKDQLNNLQKKVKGQKITITILVVAIAGLSLVAVLQARHCIAYNDCSLKGKIKEFVIKYPLINPAREFIAQEDAVTNLQPLRQFLKNLATEEAKRGFEISVYYEFLNTGANISVNPDINYYAASLVKVPIAMVAMKKIEDGEWRLDNELVLLAEDMDSDSGDLYRHKPIGTRYTIEELIKTCLIESDNTAYKILLRNISQDELGKLIDETGLFDLFDDDVEVTAKEYSRVMRVLFSASYLSIGGSQQILDWLSQSAWHRFLSQGVPQEIKFAHKFGERIDKYIYADSGIVYYPKRPYLITVMIKNKSGDQTEVEAQAAALMAKISREAFDFIQDI